MPNERIGITAAKSVQTQFREDQRRFTQPQSDNDDQDKGGKRLAQPAKGTKKQLIGTIVGIAAVIAVVILLRALQIL